MTKLDNRSESEPLDRQRRAETRAVNAVRRQQEAEQHADAETRPELAEIHHHEAKVHARSAQLQREAAELQRRHLRKHGER